MATLNNNVFANHTPITLGLLRNGAAANVSRTARDSSLATKYYYTAIRWTAAFAGDAVTFAPACPDVVLFEANTREAFRILVEAAVEADRATHAASAAAAGPAFNADAARTAARASATNRLEAIALGAVRTSLARSYHIVEADLRQTEAAASILTVNAPAAAADADAYNVAMRGNTRGWVVGLVSGNDAAGMTEAEATAINMALLTAAEVDLAFGIMSMGQVAPVRAGAQLFEDGHHYHSDGTSSARHVAIEREVIGRLAVDGRNIWKANIMLLRNVVWHASIHSIDTGVLEGLAQDGDMPARLDATGYGSFSFGLPAQEDLFNRAGSYIAVYNQISQTATAHEHRISIADLVATRDALFNIGRAGALPAQRPVLPGKPSAAWPTGCDTRAKVLKTFLEPALDAAEPVAAWMFGYYREICSRGGIRASSQEGSLLRSYSLKRAVANFLGEANRAQEMFSARARYIRAEGEKGNMERYVGNA